MTRGAAGRWWTAWLFAVMTLTCSVVGSAQEVNTAAAEALFKQGKDLFEAGKYAEACKKFQASQDLDPGVGTLLFLGDCNEKQGKTATAWGAFQQAIALAEKRGDERLEIAKLRATALDPLVSKLQVNVAKPVDGLRVRRDGVEVPASTWGTALPIDPGTYTIEATAPGRQSFTKDVTVEDGGKTVSLDVPQLKERGADTPAPGPVPAPGTTPDTTDGGGADAMVIGGAVIAGLGVAALVVGGVFGAMADGTNEDSKAECRLDGNICSAEGVSLREDAQTQARAATGLFVVGGVATAEGVTVLVIGLLDDEEPATDSARLVPWAGPEGGGLLLRGHW